MAHVAMNHTVSYLSSITNLPFNEDINSFTIWDFLTPAVMTFVPAIIFYLGFIKPMSINWQLDDVGFNHLKDGSHPTVEHKRYSKRELVRLTLKRKAVGDLPPSYPNGWFSLLESENLKRKEVRYVTALGEEFAVFRSDKGKVYIMDAYCPHLGANLAIGGTVHGNCLECPFHKWQFSGESGSCTRVSYSASCPSTARVKTWHCDEKNGFIFVWYHAEGEEPTWFIEKCKEIYEDKWTFHGRAESFTACHIQDVSENGADNGHLDAVHGSSITNGTDIRQCEDSSFEAFRHKWSVSWEQSAKELHVGTGILMSETEIFGQKLVGMKVNVLQVGPSYVSLRFHSFLGTFLLQMVTTPVEPLLQRIVQRIYAPFYLGPISRVLLYAESIMIARDMMVWNHKKYIARPILVKEDTMLAKHRRWFLQFYSANSPKYQFQKESLDW